MEMCNYLDWELTVDDPILSTFEKMVRQDFKETKSPYLNYPTIVVSRRPSAATSQFNTLFVKKSHTTSPVLLGFGSKGSSTL